MLPSAHISILLKQSQSQNQHLIISSHTNQSVSAYVCMLVRADLLYLDIVTDQTFFHPQHKTIYLFKPLRFVRFDFTFKDFFAQLLRLFVMPLLLNL